VKCALLRCLISQQRPPKHQSEFCHSGAAGCHHRAKRFCALAKEEIPVFATELMGREQKGWMNLEVTAPPAGTHGKMPTALQGARAKGLLWQVRFVKTN
jgi:hypothetical protein